MSPKPAATSGVFDNVMSFLPLILIFIIFYFLLIRPQQKKQKAHQAMLGALRRGDRVITNGGLIGTVVKLVSETEVQIEIAENTQVRVLRSMLNTVMVKGTPLSEEAAEEAPRKSAKPRAVAPKAKSGSKLKS
ncbi:MAG: preprotein translocase subunit YajC [Alphaproteobacteria bacterium]